MLWIRAQIARQPLGAANHANASSQIQTAFASRSFSKVLYQRLTHHLRFTLSRSAHFLIIFAVVCLATPLMPLALAAPPSAPLVYMSLTRRDFGDVFAGEELEQAFLVRNDGDAPLEMEQQSLTGQAAPSSPQLRAVAFSGGSSLAPTPAVLRRAAPS